MKYLKQIIVYTLIFFMNAMALMVPAQAALIGTTAVLDVQSRQASEQNIRAALAREDVGSSLQHLGVSPKDVQKRLAAMSYEDVAALSERVNRLPAGGDFFGTVGVIFVILLITDILGFTKIFPFTRSQR